jgi:hypothetical protein
MNLTREDLDLNMIIVCGERFDTRLHIDKIKVISPFNAVAKYGFENER